MKYYKATEIANHFNISVRKLNEIFEKLEWATKEKKNWIATDKGIVNGAKQLNFRGTKYIEWNEETKSKFELISSIKELKENVEIKEVVEEVKKDIIKDTKPKKMTNKEKKEKGDKYEEYIANHFRDQGYYVLEHGKEKGVEDGGIDLFAKNDKYFYFIQCKDWETSKINDKSIKATQTDVSNYKEKNPLLTELLKDYETKIIYITSKDCLDSGAKRYIKENSNIFEYRVIKYK